jgi:hypothetical protein
MFYDLPQAMMKKAFARQLWGQQGNFIKVETRFTGYMHVCVVYPLHKALVLELKTKIKGRGIMQIMARYENIPHFCFTCGGIGHAALNCEQEEIEE